MATTAEELREEVRRRYAESARAVTEGNESSCCGSGSCCEDGQTEGVEFVEAFYEADQRGELPDAAVLASLGCGNPVAVADLNEGETVLDLGSGGGIDVILSAKRVGETGIAYGLDMTDEMLALAGKNAQDAHTRGTGSARELRRLHRRRPVEERIQGRVGRGWLRARERRVHAPGGRRHA